MSRDKTNPPVEENAAKLSKDAYQDIRRMMFFNEFRPGQQVSARKLAAQQKMSLTPVVQALKILEHNGILRHETNRGFFVAKITPHEVEEVYRLREFIEVNLVPHVIAALDENGERQLREALAAYFEASRNKPIKVRLAKDMAFHMTMAKLSGQSISVWILRYLYDLLYLRYDNDLVSYRPNDVSGKEHQAIFDAVISRDVEKTQTVIRDHIRIICKGTLREMQEMKQEIENIDF